ncbi:MAG: CBS domain-containing protein [Ktedonobacteraceae bacterium]
MFYLSQVLNVPVENVQGERVGKVVDVLVPRTGTGYDLPSVLLIEGEEDQPWRVPLHAVERQEHEFRLRTLLADYSSQPETPMQDEISLAHEVIDKQVIDVEHKKAIRVNDVGFDDNWHILGIDNSNLGLVRRIAPPWLLGKNRAAILVPWADIELIGPHHSQEEQTLPQVLHATSGQLAELYPADIAEIVHQLSPKQGAQLIETLDNETAADTMEEIDTNLQRHILENIRAERAADILEAMGPDEAADLIALLPEERAEELLHLMQPEESEEVQELLEYEKDTAGGLMTTDYIVLNQTRTVTEAMNVIRTNIQENDVRIVYIYCVVDETQDECNLLGVVSLWDLLIASPEQPLQALMEADVITVLPDADPRTVAETMAKYNLLAVPVVNEEGILQGIITVDDALDVLLPDERRRRSTRMY